MEANTVTLNNSTVAVEKKMRKPALPAKFNKFIQFGYFFLKQYNDMDGVTPIDENSFLDKLHLFDTVDNQQAFVQAFFDDAKNINKTIRKVIQAKLKADKKAAAPPKVKAPRAKKTKTDVESTLDVNAQTATDGSAQGSAEPNKTSRRKKKIAVVPDLQDDLINELTSLANNTSVTTSEPITTSQPIADKPKTEKKPKADKPKVEKKPKAESKPKTDKPKVQKKTKTDKKSNTDNIHNIDNIDNDNDNDDDIMTSPILIDGKQFLIDDFNNIYDLDNHLIVGKLVDNLFTSI
jgi:hypothetical protein